MNTSSVTQGSMLNSIGLLATQGQLRTLKSLLINASPSVSAALNNRDIIRKVQDAVGLYVATPQTLDALQSQVDFFKLTTMEGPMVNAVLSNNPEEFSQSLLQYTQAIFGEIVNNHLVRLGSMLTLMAYHVDEEQWKKQFYEWGASFVKVQNAIGTTGTSNEIYDLLSAVVLYALYVNGKHEWYRLFNVATNKPIPVEAVQYWFLHRGDLEFAFANKVDGKMINVSEVTDDKAPSIQNVMQNAHKIFGEVSSEGGRRHFKLQSDNPQLYNAVLALNPVMKRAAELQIVMYDPADHARLTQLVASLFTSKEYKLVGELLQMGLIPGEVFNYIFTEALKNNMCESFPIIKAVGEEQWKNNVVKSVINFYQPMYDNCIAARGQALPSSGGQALPLPTGQAQSGAQPLPSPSGLPSSGALPSPGAQPQPPQGVEPQTLFVAEVPMVPGMSAESLKNEGTRLTMVHYDNLFKQYTEQMNAAQSQEEYDAIKAKQDGLDNEYRKSLRAFNAKYGIQ